MKLDFRQWSFRNFLDFVKFSQSGEDQKAWMLLLKIIVSWEYEASLDATGFDELYPLEGAVLLRDSMAAINDEMATLDVSIVVVDFRKGGWKNKRFREFLKARADGNGALQEKMVREVCTMPDFTPEDDRPLTFHEGARFVRAIIETYQDKLSGKA